MSDKEANQEAPTTMHITQALLGIERIVASQRMYQAAAVLSEAGKYIAMLEKRLAELEAHNDAQGEALAAREPKQPAEAAE